MSILDLSSDASFNANNYLLIRDKGVLGRHWPNELAIFNPLHSIKTQRLDVLQVQDTQCSYITSYDYIKLSDDLNSKLLKQYKLHHMHNCSTDMVYYNVLEANCDDNNDINTYVITKATPIYYQTYDKLVGKIAKLKHHDTIRLMQYVNHSSSYDDFEMYAGISNEGNIPTVIRTMHDKTCNKNFVDYYLVDKKNNMFHIELPHNKTPIDMGDKSWETYFHDVKNITK